MDIHELLLEPGAGLGYPPWIRPYTPPLVRSLGATFGKLFPSRSGLAEQATQHFATEDAATNWTPWGIFSALAPRLSSGPQAGEPTRPAVGVAFNTPSFQWKLSGVAEGWSRPLAPTPGRQPTTQLAIGRWTPFAGGLPPLPTNPQAARMVQPQL